MIDRDTINDRILNQGMVNPWHETSDVIVPFLVCVVGSVFLYWLETRFNGSRLYRRLSHALIALGSLVLLFGRNPHPKTFVVLLITAVGMWTFLLFATTMFGCFLSRIGGYDVPAEKYLDMRTGLAYPWVPAAIAAALVMAGWFLFPNFFFVAGVYYTDAGLWFLTLLVVGAMAWLGPTLLPTDNARDSEGLGFSEQQRYADILAPFGPATPNERMAVPVMTLLAGAVLMMAASGSWAENQNAAICIGLLCAAIGRTEYQRAQRSKEGQR